MNAKVSMVISERKSYIMKLKIGNLLTALGVVGIIPVILMFFAGTNQTIIELIVFVISALLLLIGICLRSAGSLSDQKHKE